MPAALTWTPQEDEQLRQLVEKHGTKAWAKIASVMRTKGSKQCRRRWKNSLNMSAKTCSWSAEEDAILIDAHRRLGNRWTEISKIFGDRTDNAVKNRWHALQRKHPNLDRGSDDSDGPPRSSKRRRTRHTATEEDSDNLDSARYGQSLQHTSSGGISAAAMPTPFDQRQLEGGARQAGAAGARQAEAARQAALQQQLAAQQQQLAAQQAWASWYNPNPMVPLQITVSKDFLSPWEQQLAGEINSMNLPVHVEVATAPMPLPLPSMPVLESANLPADVIPPRNSSWRHVDRLDEPGDSKSLQELLDYFSTGGVGGLGASGQGSKELGTGFGSRRLTRSLSKSTSSSGAGSGSLSGDHRQLLVKLMSRGLEVRTSNDQEGAGGQTPPGSGNVAARVDPFRRTRSASGKSTQERERAAAAAVQQSGLAAAAAAAAAGNGGFRVPDPPLGKRGSSRPASLSIPLIEPTPFNGTLSDVLVTPSFSSNEIALLIETLQQQPGNL